MTVTETPVLTDEQAAYVEGLRELTAFLEQHPTLIPGYDSVHLDIFAWSAEKMAELSREIGSAEKFGDPSKGDAHIGLRRTFGPHSLDINIASAEVCTHVQVGTTTVTKTVAEDKVPEGALVIGHPTHLVEVEYEEPVYEVKCPESFLGLGAQ